MKIRFQVEIPYYCSPYYEVVIGKIDETVQQISDLIEAKLTK